MTTAIPYYSEAVEQGSIEGWVMDSSTELPLVEANVTALCTETPTIFYSTTTNELGRYQFSNVEAREYIVTAFGKYGDVRYGGAKKCRVTSGETVTVNFTLTLIPVEWILVPVDYMKIQEAINAAKEGDTIFVSAGTYYENLRINKTVSLRGENKNTTIIDGNGGYYSDETVIFITMPTSIQGFIIQNGGRGIYADTYWFPEGTFSVNISNNIIRSNWCGIRYEGSPRNNPVWNISDNIIERNGWTGLLVRNIWNGLICGNIITNNNYGFSIGESPYTIVRNNLMSDNDVNFQVNLYPYWGGEGYISPQSFLMNIDSSNTVDGRPIYYWVNEHYRQVPSDTGYIALIFSSDIVVKNLQLRNTQGILLCYTDSCVVENNTLIDCDDGISAYYSSNNLIKENTLFGCCIRLHHSDSNMLTRNKCDGTIALENCRYNLIYNNIIYDEISLTRSCKNKIYNNIFSKSGIYFYESCYNIITSNNFSSIWASIRFGDGYRYKYVEGWTWGKHLSFGNYFYHNNFYAGVWFSNTEHLNVWDNGYPGGGNYWADYTGEDLYKGPYQNETGSDGIGDTPYIINENNIDRYPLMTPCPIPGFPSEMPPSQTLLSVNVFKNDAAIVSNITLFDENKTLIETVAEVFSHGWILPFGKYYVQASIVYDAFVYKSEMIEVNLADYTELAINFKFGMLTISCFDIKGRPLKNCTIMLATEGEQTILYSNELGLISLEAYYGNWTVKTYWMDVLVGETEIVLDKSELDASIVCNVGDLKVIVVDQYGNLIKANVTLTNATRGLTFSGYLDGIMEHIIFTQIPLINYTLTVKNDIEATIMVDASKTTEVVIPEFPSTLILLILITLLTIFVISVKKKIGNEKVEMG